MVGVGSWGVEAGCCKEVVLIRPGQWQYSEDVENAVVWIDGWCLCDWGPLWGQFQ